MSPVHGTSETVEPGLLVRYLDGELGEAEERELARHLAACPACRSLAADLEARADRVSAALRTADFEVPDAEEAWRRVEAARAGQAGGRPRFATPLLAAGLALAFVATAVVASAPLRTWMAERWPGAAEPGSERAAPEAAPEDGQAGHAALDFQPGGPELEVVLAAAQAGGTLTLRFGDAGAATVSVSGGGTERLTVGDGGLRIDNVATARASYDLLLPSTVERASVRIGGGPALEVTRGAVGADPVVLDLERGTVVRNPPARDEQSMDGPPSGTR